MRIKSYLILMLLFVAFLASASVPLRWTVETSRLQPAVFDVVHGERIELEASMQSYGKPLSMAGKTVSIFWQTNGMNNAWWSALATVRAAPTRPGESTPTNVLSATFTPEMDPGAATVTGFLGATGDIYRAAFTLRFRKGPGAVPNVIEQPPRVLDLAHTFVINPPWPTDQTIDARIRNVISNDNITAICPTNTIKGIVSNTVTKAYVESLGISGGGGGGVSTNAVSGIITNHVTSGYLCTVESAVSLTNNSIVGVSVRKLTGVTIADDNSFSLSYRLNNRGRVSCPKFLYYDTTYYGLGNHVGWVFKGRCAEVEWDGVIGTPTTISGYGITDAYTCSSSDARYAPTSTAVTVSSHTSQLSQLSQSVSGKADASTVAQINVQVQALGANANAEDARVIVTNYNSATRMAEAQFDVKVSNSWITVWHEMTRWNWFLGGFTTYTNGLATSLANKGEKEWGWFDSATGSPSPDGILQLAQPRIQICSGAAYQRYASTAGSYWVLESNGLVADINGTTNGYFRITDEEGNPHFEIVKGDNQTIFAKAKTMTSQVMGVTHYFTTYAITNAVSTPVAEFSRSLSSPVWIKESESGHPCNVSWTNNGDNSWTVEWWPIGNEPVLFMKAGYEKGGETYIRNVVPVSMQYIYLGNTKYLLGTATIDGHTVLTLTAQ